MCKRYSWVDKHDGSIRFLTATDVFETERGWVLQRYWSFPRDWWGHGAIRWYHNDDRGTDEGCSDFTTPKNFPPEIVQAIVAGKMWRFGVDNETMPGMLNKSARADYRELIRPLEVKIQVDYKIPSALMAAFVRGDMAGGVYSRAFVEHNRVCGGIFGDLFEEESNRSYPWKNLRGQGFSV